MGAATAIDVLIAGVGGLALTLGGIGLEVLGIQELLSGESIVGAWMIAVGLIVVFLGLNLLDSETLYDAVRGSA